MSIGAIGAGVANTFLDGDISEVRVWSVAQTQANIQANMAINLSAQTNLVALYQGNGVWTDGSSNANTLTPTNSPSNTTAANPFNAIEYGIVTVVTSSAVTVFTGKTGTIPNGTLSSPLYSCEHSPYGFPSQQDAWMVEYYDFAIESQSSPTASTWYNLGSAQISLPTGHWYADYEAFLDVTNSGATFLFMNSTLSTANNSQSNSNWTASSPFASTSLTESGGTVYRSGPISTTSQTIYYLNGITTVSGGSLIRFRGDISPTIIRARSAYL